MEKRALSRTAAAATLWRALAISSGEVFEHAATDIRLGGVGFRPTHLPLRFPLIMNHSLAIAGNRKRRADYSFGQRINRILALPACVFGLVPLRGGASDLFLCSKHESLG
jgi:hypothetical protein